MMHHQHLTIANAHFTLSIQTPHIAERLHHIFGSFQTQVPQPKSSKTFEIIQNSDETICVRSQGKTQKTYLTIDIFIAKFELQLIRAAFAKMNLIGIHSGGVICKGKTLLFPGHSGNGKTTLTLGCVLNGSTFLSDEMVLIDPNTQQAYPFPRVLCLKNDMHIFEKIDHKGLLHQTEVTRPLNNSFCVSPKSFDRVPQNQPSPVHNIIFPKYDANNKTKLTPIPPVQSLTKLLALTYKRTKTPKILDTLGNMVETVPSFELTTNNLPDALKEVENLVT